MAAPISGLCRPGIVLYLALVILAARSTHSAPVYETDSTQVAEYEGGASGCYYNFQHYQEGARIITNEPCLNCTCHNRMLMCYLRVCPFTKAIGQDCTVEKRPDQCCPVITCPQVPVQLLTSTTTSPAKIASGSTALASSSPTSTELGFLDAYGCNVDDRFYADGAQLPVDPNNPCELCYCIRNKTTCLMQQCTLSVAGCKPVYQAGICCPVKYNCEYDEENMAATTPGLIMTTTMAPRTTPPQCHHDSKMYEDGELIYTIQPCQHCYCFHGEIVCAVQECGKPMESHGKNCTALPPLDGECCPTTYQCEDDFGNIATEIPEIVDKKDVTDQPAGQGENQQQESFPGADNAIPEEIPTTEKQQTVSPLGNEVPEIEPTKSSFTEVPGHDEQQQTTLTPENDSTKPTEAEQPEIKEGEFNHPEATSELTSSIDESSETPTESDKEVSNASEAPENAPSEASSEIPSRIGENAIEDNLQSTESSTHSEESTESKTSLNEGDLVTPTSMETEAQSEPNVSIIADNDGTTIVSQVKEIEKSPDQELTGAVSTEEPSVEATTAFNTVKDKVDVIQPDALTTEKSDEQTLSVSEVTEKSSEISSPVNKTMPEENIIADITESVLSSSSTEAEKAVETTENSAEMDQSTTIKSTPESIKDKEDEEFTTLQSHDATTASSEENKPKETVPKMTPESSTSASADEESNKSSEPISTEAPSIGSTDEDTKPEDEVELTPESTSLASPEESGKPTERVPESSTDSSIEEKLDKTDDITTTEAVKTVSPSEDKKPVENISEIIPESPESTTAVTEEKEKSTEIDKSSESSTSSNLDEETDKNVGFMSTEASSAVPLDEDKSIGTTTTPITQEISTTEETVFTIEQSSEKSGTDETSSQTSVITDSSEKSPSEDHSESKVPEQGPTGIPIPDRVPEHKAEDKDAVTDSEVTEGYVVTGSGVPHKVDNLLTEQPESGPTTYLPPVGSSTEERQPSTPLYEDLPKENVDVLEQTTELSITPKGPSDKTTVDEVSPTEDEEPSVTSSDMPTEEHPSDKELTSATSSSPELSSSETDKKSDEESTQQPTQEPSVDEMTQLPVSSEKPTPEKEEIDKSEVSEGTVSGESTTASSQEEDHTSPIASVEKSDEDKNKEQETPETIDEIIAETSTPEIESDITNKPIDLPVSEPTDKPIVQESTDKSVTTPTLSSEKPESVNDVEHQTNIQASSTESEPSEEKSIETISPTEIPNAVESESGEPVISEEKLDTTTESNKDEDEQSITDITTQSADKIQIGSTEITDKEKDQDQTTKGQVDTEDTTVSIETKVGDEDLSKVSSTTESGIENEPVEHKSETAEPQEPETTPTTHPVTGSVTDELMSTIDSSEESTETQSDKEGGSSHSTEANVMSSQTPEMTIPSEVRPSSGIPGEGNCLVDGQSYSNNSAVPPANACQLSCRCVSSIVQCDLVQCSPPPSDVPNCTPVYSEAHSCCPMYTCESTPSIPPEADNQMFDHHTSTSTDKSVTQTTQNSVVDESTDATEKTSIKDEVEPESITTESSIKSHPETTSEVLESEKEIVPSESPTESETSSSTISEGTVTSTEADVSIKSTDEETSIIPEGTDKHHEENMSTVTSKPSESEEEITSGTTVSIQTSPSEAIEMKDKLPGEENVTTPETEEEILSQSTDLPHKPTKPEDSTSVSIETSSISSEDLATNIPEQIDVTTQSSKSTESESDETISAKPIEEVEPTEKSSDSSKPEPESTVALGEPIDSVTDKSIPESVETSTASAELTSADTIGTNEPSVEEQTQKPGEPEVEKEPIPVEASSPVPSSSESFDESTATQSSISETPIDSESAGTQKPEIDESEPELTKAPIEEASETSVTSEPTLIEEETKKPDESITPESEVTKNVTEDSTSGELSSTSSSVTTEKDLTVPVFVGTDEEHTSSSEPSSTETSEEITPKEHSDEASGTSKPSSESEDVTSPNLIETSEEVTEKDQPSTEVSSTATSLDESSHDIKPSDKTQPDETPLIAQPPEPEHTESGETTTERISVTQGQDKPEEKKPDEEKSEKESPGEVIPKQEVTESTNDVTSEAQTVSEESTTLSTPSDVEEPDVKEKPTESSVDEEKKTSEPSIELTTLGIDSKISVDTETSTVSQDQKEITEGVSEANKVEESSSPIIDEFIGEDEKSPASVETSTEISGNKDKIDETEVTTSSKVAEETPFYEQSTTIEPTKVEAFPGDQILHTSSESPNKELMSTLDESSSEETSVEGENKDFTTPEVMSETSSDEPTTSEKAVEKEPSSTSTSEEPTPEAGSPISEVPVTTMPDVQDQSTKAAIPTDEQSSLKPSEAITPDDDQYHVDQQTEEQTVPGINVDDEQKPIEDHTSTVHPETSKPHARPDFPDQQMPETDDENVFPPDGADIKNQYNPDESETDPDDYDDQAIYGPGTCRYGGKIYMSAQQIPRDDACDFCFCFRSDIICLQQSCPPPIPGCHEEPIGGFCCPRYECPVSMATSLNVTTTTTTTTTTVPPHFLSHAYKGSAVRGGCQIGNKAYRIGEDIKSKTGPCMSCTCGGDGKMKCEPRACSASPMLKEMIAHAAARKRRR